LTLDIISEGGIEVKDDFFFFFLVENALTISIHTCIIYLRGVEVEGGGFFP